jgi:hypothetical protein
MKVKLLTIYASPQRCAQPGDVIEVPAPEGAALIQGGYAEAVKETIETTSAPAAENAALRGRRHGR